MIQKVYMRGGAVNARKKSSPLALVDYLRKLSLFLTKKNGRRHYPASAGNGDGYRQERVITYKKQKGRRRDLGLWKR